VNLEGKAALSFSLPGMTGGDVPVAGDWEGAHKAAPGFYRPADHTWHLFRSAAEELTVIPFGYAGGVPLTGDWTGDGRSKPGIYLPERGYVLLLGSRAKKSPSQEYTVPLGSPVVVNWSGTGVDTVNTVNHGVWFRQVANCQCHPGNPVAAFTSRLSEGQLFAGRWKIPQGGR